MAVKLVGILSWSSSGAVGQEPLPRAGWVSAQHDGLVSRVSAPGGPDGSYKTSYEPDLKSQNILLQHSVIK